MKGKQRASLQLYRRVSRSQSEKRAWAPAEEEEEEEGPGFLVIETEVWPPPAERRQSACKPAQREAERFREREIKCP